MTDQPPTRFRACPLLVSALLVATLAAVAGCGPGPTPEPAAFDGRLLVLTGRPEAFDLQSVDGRGGVTEIESPEGGLRAFAAALDGRLAGVDADGAVVVSDGVGLAWRLVPLGEVPLGEATADVRLPAWSADGRLAVLFGDAETATVRGVLLADPSTDGTFWIDLDGGLGGYPPTWLDGARLAVPTRDADDRQTLAILEVDTSRVVDVREDVRSLAASADRSTLVLVGRDARTVEVWRPAGWESGQDSALLARFEAAPVGSVVDALALDATGDRLALGIVAPDGRTASRIQVIEPIAPTTVLFDHALAGAGPIEALAFSP